MALDPSHAHKAADLVDQQLPDYGFSISDPIGKGI
jgi:hypothetical protein